MKRILQYLALIWPPLFRKVIQKIDSDAYQRGWNNGFDKGHLRGWMQLRNKVHNGGNKYPHERTNERN